MQSPSPGKEEPLQQYRLKLTGRGAAPQILFEYIGKKQPKGTLGCISRVTTSRSTDWQMCLSPFPKYSDGNCKTEPSFGLPMQEKHWHIGPSSADTTKMAGGLSPVRRGWGQLGCVWQTDGFVGDKQWPDSSYTEIIKKIEPGCSW